ncbi:hypothetical protein P154DRAFT_467585, partial [Amniculicola lignicola CBS 123094]
MAQSNNPSKDWLARYASNFHAWQRATLNGGLVFKRPLGLVEYSFDTDGTDFQGRADMNALLALEMKALKRESLGGEELRRRILLAWTLLRLQHVLLMSRAVDDEEQGGRRSFVVGIPQGGAEEVVREAGESVVWVEDFYEEVDGDEFLRHCRNVGRLVVPERCLSRLHILPKRTLKSGNVEVRVLITMAHQISDGLTAYNWIRNFVRVLNLGVGELEREIEICSKEEEMRKRLPPAQESLYPRIPGNKARQRWFWAIMRILRHVRRPLPQTFINPLRREQSLTTVMSLPPIFPRVFDYTEAKRPPNNGFQCLARLSKTASTKVMHLCRSNGISIGAGGFALAGLSMMDLEEQRHPNIPDSDRPPFVTSFPLNPRMFFGYSQPADSCMLAFSDGIVLPFLPSHLPVKGRFLLLAKAANRQLRMYQKRVKRNGESDVRASIDSHSPIRLLANGYLESFDRIESKLPPHKRSGLTPQGAYPPTFKMWAATCGVSSVGSTASFVRRGMYDLDSVGTGPGQKDFAIDFRDYRVGVRARENEFLVGSSSNSEGIMEFSVSFDGSAIEEKAAQRWVEKIEGLLEGEG